MNKYQLKWLAKNPDYHKEYYKKNAARYIAKSRRRYKEKREEIRDERLQALYDITLSAYTDMLASQNGACKICKRAPTANQILAVDHCHTTGRVRGLLCNNCNNGLGRFKDNTYLLQSAIDYLNEIGTA